MLASAPRLRAVLSEANTTDERIPMIAITTSNSIKVKPRFVFIVISFCSLPIIPYVK